LDRSKSSRMRCDPLLAVTASHSGPQKLAAPSVST
jgi:hypothetical protein